jgi:iron complex outermembrane receptor protein
MSTTRHPLASAISALLLIGLNSGANAQTTPESPASSEPTELGTITVTGSHIKRAAISGVGPVTVIDRETIERSGATSVETLLQRIPASAGFAGNQTNAYWAENGYGTTQVNLRGLGINRTLVLLNGRRVVNGGTGANSSVDLNIIPIAMVERIEVLKDGASAIYGADAVAGVVNLITKRNFDGVEASVRYGQTFEGDGKQKSADLTWGTTGEAGSLMAGISYSETGTVNMADRAACGLGESDGQLVCFGSSSTIGGRAVLPDGTSINFNQDPNGDGDFYEPYSSARHNFNSNPYLNAVNPIKRVSFNAFGNLNVSENVSAFAELMYTHRESDQIATPGTLGIYRPILISADHPTNPTGEDLLLQRRRLLEGGVREFYQETDTSRLVLGLNGRLGMNWDWNVAFNVGRNTGIDGSTNVANLDRVEQTLDTSVCSNASGAAIPCADYLGYGDVSQAVLDYIMFTSRDTGGNSQESFTANLSGDLFELPAGPVGMATGIEVRKEEGWRDPDPLTVASVANTNQQDPIAGEYLAKEAFVEFAVPLLANTFLAQSLTLNAAGRYSDYDLFGSDTNYKVGLDWQVVPSLKIRANYATAFRIPNIPELFGGVAEGNLTTTDPCSGWSSQPSTSVIYQKCQDTDHRCGLDARVPVRPDAYAGLLQDRHRQRDPAHRRFDQAVGVLRHAGPGARVLQQPDVYPQSADRRSRVPVLAAGQCGDRTRLGRGSGRVVRVRPGRLEQHAGLGCVVSQQLRRAPVRRRRRDPVRRQDHRRPGQLRAVEIFRVVDHRARPVVGHLQRPVHRPRRRHQCGRGRHR